MIRLLQSSWMVALIGGLLYLGTTFLSFPSSATLRKSLPQAPDEVFTRVAEPSWNFRNPDLEQMIRELKEEKNSLSAREQAVKELETRLRAEQAEFSAVTQLVARLQKEFDQNVLRLKESETTNLKRLAKTHAAMTPEGSANILKELTDEEVTKILVYLKADEAGPVLEALGRLGKDEAKRAALLSEKLRRTLPPGPAAK